MNLFDKTKLKFDIELSTFKKKEKIVQPKYDKPKLVPKKLNKVSQESIPMFKSEELRKKAFPNHPPLKPKRIEIKTSRIRWINGKYYELND